MPPQSPESQERPPEISDLDLGEDLFARLQAVLEPDGDGPNNAPDTDRIAHELTDEHPADIAEAMSRLSDREALLVFNALDTIRAAEVLDEVDPDTARYLDDHGLPGRIAEILDILPMDDAANLVSTIAEEDEERAEELLRDLQARNPEDAAEIQELLSYGEQTAGRLMTDKFVRLAAFLSVEEAFAAVRKSDPDVETLSDLYVVEVDQNGRDERLIGVLSLRDLIRAQPEQIIGEIMVDDPITVGVDTDQEEVARMIAKYDFMALPVLARDGFLAGIVTVDDIVDVLVQEQTEDVLKQGAVEPGIANQPYFAVPIPRVIRSRITWLVILFFAGTLTSSVLQTLEGGIKAVPELLVFIPLLIGTGGNTGAQTVSTVIRAMSLKEIRTRDAVRVAARELLSGVLLGLSLGVIAFVFAYLFKHRVDVAMVVALTVVVICIWSNLIGCLIPLAAQKLKLDPALVSSPFITTLVDATGLAIYIAFAHLLIAQL